MSEVF